MLFAVVHMYTCALIYWAVTVYSLLQAIVDPAQYALLDAYSAGARSKVTLACLGLNVRLYASRASGWSADAYLVLVQ